MAMMMMIITTMDIRIRTVAAPVAMPLILFAVLLELFSSSLVLLLQPAEGINGIKCHDIVH